MQYAAKPVATPRTPGGAAGSTGTGALSSPGQLSSSLSLLNDELLVVDEHDVAADTPSPSASASGTASVMLSSGSQSVVAYATSSASYSMEELRSVSVCDHTVNRDPLCWNDADCMSGRIRGRMLCESSSL